MSWYLESYRFKKNIRSFKIERLDGHDMHGILDFQIAQPKVTIPKTWNL